MRGPKRFDIDQLVEDVMQAFEDYPPEQLEKMWQHKSYVRHASCARDQAEEGRLELPAPRPRETPPLERL